MFLIFILQPKKHILNAITYTKVTVLFESWPDLRYALVQEHVTPTGTALCVGEALKLTEKVSIHVIPPVWINGKQKLSFFLFSSLATHLRANVETINIDQRSCRSATRYWLLLLVLLLLLNLFRTQLIIGPDSDTESRAALVRVVALSCQGEEKKRQERESK